MSFLASAFAKKAAVFPLSAEILAISESKSGKSVTTANALKVATVLACVRVISEGVAQVPLTGR